MYIAFEGVIGSGKTTQSKRVYEYFKCKYPTRQVIWTREPGGSEIAEEIRTVVQRTKFDEDMDPVCEAYLYAASRAQTLRNVVKPVLDAGGIAISDRTFLTSYTNQAFGREMGLELVSEINKAAVDGIKPDLILFFNIDIKIGMQRAFDHGGDKFENLGEEFYTKVHAGYTFLETLPEFKDKWITIDATGSEDEVFTRILQVVEPRL